jgi:AcrR family transcriptional regulator
MYSGLARAIADLSMTASVSRRNLRESLVKAANKRILEGGIASLSLRKLAKDTGVTTMATYHHFRNKEALLVQIAVNGYTELAELMKKEAAAASTPREAVRRIVRVYFRFALKKPNIYHLMFGREIQGKPHIPEFKKAANESFYIMANAIKAHLDDSEHDVDADAVGLSFWCTLHGLVCLVTDGTILYQSQTDEKIERLIDRAVKGLFFFH